MRRNEANLVTLPTGYKSARYHGADTMNADEVIKLMQAATGLTVTGLLVLIVITGQKGVWVWRWVVVQRDEQYAKAEARLEAQIELERKDKNEWKSLALKVTGLAEATVDLVKQKGAAS